MYQQPADRKPVNGSLQLIPAQGFHRLINYRMPFDLTHDDPNKNYGIHGMDLWMIVQKDNRAIQFGFTIPFYLPHVADELFWKVDRSYNPFEGQGFDVGYHSPTPLYEGQSSRECNLISGPCYYDGTSLGGEEWYQEFLKVGFEGMWHKLYQQWHDRFKS